MKKRKCPYCKDPNAGRAFANYTCELHYGNIPYEITIPDLELMKCPSCDWRTLPDDSFDKLTDELRRQANVLFPADIKAGREKLGLSQKEFGLLFGVGEATVQRWEDGGQIHQRSKDNAMRVLFNEGS